LCISDLLKELCTKKYTGGGIREYILSMTTLAAKLASMDMVFSEPFVIQVILASLPRSLTPLLSPAT
jgi:hypothetical protein